MAELSTAALAKKREAANEGSGAWRETVESVVVAVILALLFRAFIAEAFVIPTGSMAPTLMGRHVDVWCDKCNYHYQASGSSERTRDDSRTKLVVSDTRCPNCAYRMELDKSYWSNQNSFSGDRIVVSKFAFLLSDPKRWDVIVFKFPGEAQQNYIKRLIGLPGETIKLGGGNVYTKSRTGSDFAIARKGDPQLLALLQTVHDSDFPSPELQSAGWPLRWQNGESSTSWKANDDGTSYTLDAASGLHWVRYHQYEPDADQWDSVLNKSPLELDPDWRGRLISDFYAYNCERLASTEDLDADATFRDEEAAFGQYWVDDLALECEVDIKEAVGNVVLDIVRAGTHFTCRIDAKTGQATLAATDREGNNVTFEGDNTAAEATSRSAATALKGAGNYRLRMSNVDHEIRLWINGSRAAFDGPATYASETLVFPDIQSADGDLAPLGIAGEGQSMTVKHLRVLRDKYYIASRFRDDEYGYVPPMRADVESPAQEIVEILKRPTEDKLLAMLRSRREREFVLGDDQFFPLGDNSPASSDARYWPDRPSQEWNGPYVERRLLVGRALMIYWPHTWNWPPYLPNFRRIQPIH